jgi:hypothetical protein
MSHLYAPDALVRAALRLPCSWLNAFETFFAKITKRRLERNCVPFARGPRAAIERFLHEHVQSPQAFRLNRQPRASQITSSKGTKRQHRLTSLQLG